MVQHVSLSWRFLTHWLLNPEGRSDADLIALSRLYIIFVLIVIGGACLVFSIFVIFLAAIDI